MSVEYLSTAFIILYYDQSIFPNVTFFLFNSINSLFQNFNINFTFYVPKLPAYPNNDMIPFDPLTMI